MTLEPSPMTHRTVPFNTSDIQNHQGGQDHCQSCAGAFAYPFMEKDAADDEDQQDGSGGVGWVGDKSRKLCQCL